MSLTIRAREFDRLRHAIAEGGMVNLGLAGETAAKGHAPVAGGHRTFNPDQPIGGTLRRSIHFVVYIDGQRVSPRSADENGAPLPDYVPRMGIVCYIGSNSGYGFWVHEGTTRMPGRPFILEGWNEIRSQAEPLIAVGTRRKLGQ